jgi:hypothetical protein
LLKPHTVTDIRHQIWTVWLAFTGILVTATGADPDLWGHVRFGLDWWQTGSLPTTDPYSFTQDRPWINHEWLSEALMAGAYRLAGPQGLILLKTAVVSLTLWIAGRRLRGTTPAFSAFVLIVVIFCMTPVTLTVRPQLWSLLGLVALLALIDREDPPDSARIFAGGFLFALWANLHGGWITGAGVLATYLIVRVIRERRSVGWWSGFAVASALGTLVNPYGIGLWRFLAVTVRSSRPDIGEWASLDFSSPLILWAPLFLVAGVAIVLARRAETRPRLAGGAVLLLLLVTAARVGRVAPLVAPAALVILAPSLSTAWGHIGRVSVPAAAGVVFWAPAVVGFFAAAQPVAHVFTCLPIRGEWAPDPTTAAYLRGASGTLLTTFDWGEYAIWHFGPRLKVSIDGRRETVYSDSVIQWHRAFERGEPDAQNIVARLSPDYVWLRSSRPLAKQWLIERGYEVVVDNANAFVAKSPETARLSTPAEPMGTCFP